MDTRITKKTIVTTIAYLIGVKEDKLDSRYSEEYGDLLNELAEDDDAHIIRILCVVRSIIMQKFSNIDSMLRYDLKNLDRIEYFNADEIKWISRKNVPLIQTNVNASQYLIHVNKLITERISTCKRLFPDWVVWEYIKDLFVIPGTYGNNDAAIVRILKSETGKYCHSMPLYPFGLYINWEPGEYGNILANDRRFLELVYAQHGVDFKDESKVMDVTDEVKNSIYDFIEDNEKVMIVVDCENSDVYKLYSVLKGLDKDKLSKIKKLILYDDYHTTNAWKLMGKLFDIEVEYIDVERVMESKSLVDIKMTAGVCREYYLGNASAFILASSDSDFWGLISSLEDADFLVMYENNKCSDSIKRLLREHEMFYCSIDDFCKGNIDHIKNLALKTELQNRLTEFNRTGIMEDLNSEKFIEGIFRACRIEMTPSERSGFVEHYIRKIQFGIGQDGNFELSVKK